MAHTIRTSIDRAINAAIITRRAQAAPAANILLGKFQISSSFIWSLHWITSEYIMYVTFVFS